MSSKAKLEPDLASETTAAVSFKNSSKNHFKQSSCINLAIWQVNQFPAASQARHRGRSMFVVFAVCREGRKKNEEKVVRIRFERERESLPSSLSRIAQLDELLAKRLKRREEDKRRK